MKQEDYEFKLGEWTIILIYNVLITLSLVILMLWLDEIILGYISLAFSIISLITCIFFLYYFSKVFDSNDSIYKDLKDEIKNLKLEVSSIQSLYLSERTLKETYLNQYSKLSEDLNNKLINLKEQVSKIRNQKDKEKLLKMIDNMIDKLFINH